MPELTKEQLERREANRQRALARLQATKERLLANRGLGANTNQARVDKGKAPDRSGNSSIASASASGGPASQHRKAEANQPLGPVNPKFQNYVEYNFAKMVDSKGGFINEESAESSSTKSMDEWISRQKDAQPQHPDAPKCFDCGTVELDFRMYNWFKTRICRSCRNKNPDKYSLLTKTECKEDYLLTDPELRDEELLPHVEKPNPHKTTYNNMMLYMRYQVEEYAFKKWGGPEGLDAEYEKRVAAKKKRKDKKFLDRLREMRRNTRAEIITKRSQDSGPHSHEWSEPVKNGNLINRRCMTCGMTTEELSFDI